MKHALLFLVALLMAGVASASEPAIATVLGNTKTFTLCSDEGSSGVCDTAAGVDLYAEVATYRQYTVYLSQTGGTTATCDIYVGDRALSISNGGAMPASLSNSDGTKINSTLLSSTSTAQSFEGPFWVMWITCTDGDGTHTVTMQATW